MPLYFLKDIDWLDLALIWFDFTFIGGGSSAVTRWITSLEVPGSNPDRTLEIFFNTLQRNEPI